MSLCCEVIFFHHFTYWSWKILLKSYEVSNIGPRVAICLQTIHVYVFVHILQQWFTSFVTFIFQATTGSCQDWRMRSLMSRLARRTLRPEVAPDQQSAVRCAAPRSLICHDIYAAFTDGQMSVLALQLRDSACTLRTRSMGVHSQNTETATISDAAQLFLLFHIFPKVNNYIGPRCIAKTFQLFYYTRYLLRLRVYCSN